MIGDAVINDGPGLMLIVEKFPWANTLDVTRGVEAALEALQPGPARLEIDSTIFRPATFIEMSIDNLTHALLIGACWSSLVLVAFLYEWRVALISLVAIPLSLMAAGLVLYCAGRDASTRWCWPASWSPSASSSTTPSSTSRTSCGACGSTARRAAPSRRRAIILEASLEVRSADRLCDADHRAGGDCRCSSWAACPARSSSRWRSSYVLALLASMVVALTVTPALA